MKPQEQTSTPTISQQISVSAREGGLVIQVMAAQMQTMIFVPEDIVSPLIKALAEQKDKIPKIEVATKIIQ